MNAIYELCAYRLTTQMILTKQIKVNNFKDKNIYITFFNNKHFKNYTFVFNILNFLRAV